VKGGVLRLRMTLTSEDAPLEHVVETTIDLEPAPNAARQARPGRRRGC
jgi:hypothetical protein